MKTLNKILLLLIFLLFAGVLFACNSLGEPIPKIQMKGLTYIISKGNPPANKIFWSPKESSKILVNGFDIIKRKSQIRILDFSTMKRKILVDADYGNIFGSGWSSDGKQVVLSVDGSTKLFPQSGLWLLNIEDTSSEHIFAKSGSTFWLSNSNNLAMMVLDFASAQSSRQISVYIMAMQTREIKKVFSNEDAIAFSGLSLSPDGQRMIFDLDFGVTNVDSDLFVLDIQSGSVKQLTFDGASSGSQWSPVGDVIVYEKSNKNSFLASNSLHLMHPDGSCDIEIPNINFAHSPTWSPDGRKIAFIGEDGIYVLDANIVFGRDIYQNLCQ